MQPTVLPQFSHSCPGDVEDANAYCPGGLHPIFIGDCFSVEDRYKVLHKLGFGASSTVWLARDQHQDGRLVALKALRADNVSSNNELAIQKHLQATDPPIPNIQTVLDHFYVDGPNGTHLFLIYPSCGPSIMACSRAGMFDATARLRGDLAHKIIKQLIEAVDGLHRAGVVHGDITTDNLLFSLPSEVHKWTDAEVYDVLGNIVTIPIVTKEGMPVPTLPPGVPAELILPTSYALMIERSAMLNESIVLGSLGQSFVSDGAVGRYMPETLITYVAPETRFENRAGFEADVWQLGCAIYEIRAGGPLFNPIMNSPEIVLALTVGLLGRLPDPWWGQFENRDSWFWDDGKPKRDGGSGVDVVDDTSIRELLTSIGDDDSEPEDKVDTNSMFEKPGVVLAQGEVELLEDLLEKMLRYKPEDRIKLPEVTQHPYLLSSDGMIHT